MRNNNKPQFSARAEAVATRTYSRPKPGGALETWDEVVARVIEHQRWLWEAAKGDVPLTVGEGQELEELRELLLSRKASVSGRTLWLGGTDVAKSVMASQFNCSGLRVATVHDVVDAYWLLLQGCFSPDTVVKMSDGSYKAIKDIVPGDKVLSYDENTGEFKPSVVSRLNENMPKPMVKVTFEDGTDVLCTEDHLFMTSEGWVEAKKLINKEVVSYADGKSGSTEIARA